MRVPDVVVSDNWNIAMGLLGEQVRNKSGNGHIVERD